MMNRIYNVNKLMVLKSSQNNLLDQLNTANVINKAGAESIKKSFNDELPSISISDSSFHDINFQ